MINIMEANQGNQLRIMENHLIQEGKSSINTFQPWKSDIWKSNDIYQDQRIPSQMEITSMIKHKDPRYTIRFPLRAHFTTNECWRAPRGR
jgi:hypothetical protein